ncbi:MULTISPECIES: YlmH/Sll1252 family protein [Exiguobacterium]|uniref:YlmH family RNA-binding protein n=1 Tax=Exiguobacterium TaxID=33986 RepID=UPI00047B00B8|nr:MULTISPECIES: YlmH/Sll1252 family protein [Exiguobacterium]MCK2156827.1 YlmH/Sll1252 family protein [Exiguobacterium sp. 17-1]
MSVYDHYRGHEREFVDLVLNWIDHVEATYTFKVTDFLDPREQQITRELVGTKCALFFEGGFEGAERQRALIAPDYYDLDANDFDIAIYRIHYPTKFVELSHRQVTGTLLNVGLKRGKFGDVVIQDQLVQFAVAKEVASYIEANVDRAGKTKIRLSLVDSEEQLKIKDQEWQEELGFVSSLRFDTVVSEILGFSRQKAQSLIKQGESKVNYKIVEDPSFLLEEGDLLSLRGTGRVKLIAVLGSTKRDRIKLQYGLLKG